MATRAATFTAKVRTLYDYHLRTVHNILPLPSGIDIANTLKYFSQTLLAVLRDVPTISLELMQSKDHEQARMSMFPNLDYKGFFHAVVQLVDIVPLIHYGATVLGHAILHSLACLVPFLEHEYMDTLPFLVASCMALFPPTLHKDIVNMLCNLLLPFTITPKANQETHQNYATSSTAAICMFVFQYSEYLAYHCKLLECLMTIKPNVLCDLLCVIAHGTSSARAAAANLLFYYWPLLNPALHDRRGIQVKFTGWEPLKCQRENCLSPVNNEAVKMCLDHSVAIGSGDHPPPLYICQDCADEIRRDEPKCLMQDVLLPLQQISITCENKNCRSSDKTAISTCFSFECASYNANRPIRYCSQCHTIRHNNRRGIDHVFHLSVKIPWQMDPETQNYMVEAIVSLLKEAQPIPDRRYKDVDERYPRIAVLDSEINPTDAAVLEERRLLSRYGIYLLVGLCTPTEDTPLETLGRLLGMLFQWFDALAYLPDDQAGNTLERLKSEYIHGWLMDVCQSNFEVFVSCLLPHPVEYARVGGHWDSLVNRTSHIKDGFNRLFCLVPYEIINPEVWDYIMPHWMEAIRNEVPEEELAELRILLSKVLDPEMSPLGFSAQEMYRFIAMRFQNVKPQVQEQALSWLQILSLLNVVVPLSLLFSMFTDGIKSCTSPSLEPPAEEVKVLHSHKDDFPTGSIMGKAGGDVGQPGFCPEDKQILHILGLKTDTDLMLPCFVLMLDILLKQLQLQEVDPHQGIEHIVSRESLVLIENMVCASSVNAHDCEDTSHDCIICELITTFYQLALEIIEYISPVVEPCKTDITTDGDIMGSDDSSRRGSPVEELSLLPFCPPDIPYSPQDQEDKQELCMSQLFTATVQTVFETELDTVAIMPPEEVVKAVARAVTLTETDVGLAKVSVALPAVVDENDQAVSKDAAEDDGSFWHTSQGKFKFTLDELPPQLKLIYDLLKELSNYESADILYHILGCLKFLCLHAECLSLAGKDYRGFLIWCQENLIMKNLWHLLQAEHSHISQICVQILNHCITLPSGTDIFWKIIEENFNNEEWTVRSAAVEKVTMIARFVEREPIKQSQLLQSSLANAFCYLISSMDDVHATVAQKAMLCLDTIKDSSLRVLCLCLEIQFDTIILDRPMILQTIFQLYTHLNDRKILTWEFFLHRFDSLFLETQVILEHAGEIAYPRDLKNTDMNSETFLRKLNRAHEALSLSQHDSVRSLSMSLGAKLHYKRAMSAPGGMIMRQEKMGKIKEVDKEKLFSRQSSAPVLKRKCSKFGIAQVVGQLPNHLFPDGNLKEPQQEENNFLAMLHRVMEMEDSDKDTMHLLLFLFMQFLSHPEHAYPSDEKSTAKIQNVVLRHLNVLLGYSPQDRSFCTTPFRLRSSPIFSAFLFSLPSVLDHNFKMGTLMLSTCLPLLQYCPSPQHCSSEIQQPLYSIWYLEPYARHSWLMAVLTFIYKYRYSSLPISRHVQNIIRIILNTLEAQDHRCHQLHEGCLLTTPNASRSKDLGSMSTSDVPQIQDGSPPHSPGIPVDLAKVASAVSAEMKTTPKTENQESVDSIKYGEGAHETGTVSDRSDWAQWKPRKLADFSFSSDLEDEPELEAIPESPKSETSPESLKDSLTELDMDNMEDDVTLSQIGKDIFIENSVVVTSTCLSTSLKVMPLAIVDNPVESEMALQIKAFNESFDKEKLVTPESAFDQLVKDPANSFKYNKKLLAKTRSFDDGKFYVNKRCEGFSRQSATNKSVVVQPSRKVEESLRQITKPPTDSQPSTKETPFPCSENQVQSEKQTKSKLHRSFTMDCEMPISSKSDGSTKNLEILDARQLEESIRRREPAVISQCIQQTTPPYLFQPIQAHPITTHTPDSNGKYKLEQKVAQPIKVEPKPVGLATDPSTPMTNFQVASPWTVEKQLPRERLFAISKDSLEEKDEIEMKPKTSTQFSSATNKQLQQEILNSSDKKIIKASRSEQLKRQDSLQQDTNNSLQHCLKQSEVIPKQSITLQPLTGQVIKEGPHPRTFHIEPAVACQEENNSCRDKLNRKTSWKSDPKMRSFFKYNVDQAHSEEASETQSETPSGNEESHKNLVESEKKYEKVEHKETAPHNASAMQTHLKKDNDNGMSKQLDVQKSVEKKFQVSSKKIGLPKQHSFAGFHCLDDQTLHAFHPVESGAPLIRSKSVSKPISSKLSSSDNCSTSECHKQSEFLAKLEIDKSLEVDASKFVIDAPLQVTLKDMTETEDEPLPRLIRHSIKRLTKQNPITDIDLQHQSSGSTEAPSLEGGGDDVEGVNSHHSTQDHEDQKGRSHFRRRQRKIGISAVEMQKFIDQRNSINRKSKKDSSQNQSQRPNLQPSSLRCGEDTVVEKCPECGAILEQYSDEELSMCIVILATFVHREPALAAPTLPEIIRTVARIAACTMYAWQQESNTYLPGGASSVAKQFIRCVLHQLAPNGIFLQLFQSVTDDAKFFKTIASALTDFNELNPAAPLQLLLEGLNDCKVFPVNTIQQILYNVAIYMECLPLETASSSWSSIIPQFDVFIRKLHLILSGQIFDTQPMFQIMISLLKIPGLHSFKSILDPFSKMLSHAIQNCSLRYRHLLDLCHLCNRAFTKERDKLLLSRTAVFELIQALKFKSNISDSNLLMLVQFVVQDAGGTLGPCIIMDDEVPPVIDVQNMINTSACECMRQHLNDALDFVADVHTLSKVKSNFKGTMMGLNEDTLGAALKAGIAQYLALEITRGNNRENRAISRYLPWLCNPPTAVQQGPKEFLDCVAHIRLLSWLLLGALTHTAMLGNNSSLVCQPIPLEASCHVADHIQVILTGFAEQSKASVLHMSSLFHAFILCQLWTMYCEQMASLNPPGSEHHNAACITLTDFWAKVTPSILQLLSHSKILAEMVNLHFLSLMEALLECNSTVLAKIFPLWSPVLYAYQGQLPGHLQVRLQLCEDRNPPMQTKDEIASTTHTLLKWLQRIQFKMGQIELQSSAATQFYSV